MENVELVCEFEKSMIKMTIQTYWKGVQVSLKADDGKAETVQTARSQVVVVVKD